MILVGIKESIFMEYLVIILALALAGVLGYFGFKKYNEIHEDLEIQRQEIADQEDKLVASQKEFEAKEEMFNQERDIFNLEKKVFLRSKAAKFEMDDKTEKEIAIELYTHFIQMESEFARYQRSLDSLDKKLIGVQDYSEQMDNLSAALCDQFTLYKNNLVTTNEKYVETLENLQKDVNRIMDTLMSEMEDIVTESATKTFTSLNKDVHVLMENTSNDVSQQILANMPKALQKEDVQIALEQVINYSVKARLEEILNTLKDNRGQIVETVVEEFAPVQPKVEEKEIIEELLVEDKVEEPVEKTDVQADSNAEELVLEMLS